MGVFGLWDILLTAASPAALHQLSGKILAIDASIWIVRMSYIAEDHKKLRSLLERIVSMKKHNILPLFVFDGAPPAIKRKTLLLRRQKRVSMEVEYQKKAQIELLKKLHNPEYGNEESRQGQRKSESQQRQIHSLLQRLKNVEQSQAISPQLLEKVKLQSQILTTKYTLIVQNDAEHLGAMSAEEFSMLDLETKQQVMAEIEELRWKNMREGVSYRRRPSDEHLSQEEKMLRDIRLIEKKSIIREMQDQLYRKMVKNTVREENGFQIIEGVYNGKKVIQRKKIKSSDSREERNKGKMKNDFDSIMRGMREGMDEKQKEEEGDMFLGQFLGLKPQMYKSNQDNSNPQNKCDSQQSKRSSETTQSRNQRNPSLDVQLADREQNEQDQNDEFQGLQIDRQNKKRRKSNNAASAQQSQEKFKDSSQFNSNADNMPKPIFDQNINYNNSSHDNRDLQHFLIILGVPFIVAKGEAEAECANLEKQGLVDGIVTEDSDVFLFGAKNVYRGLFESNIRHYSHSKIERSLKFSQQKLIIFAMFMGSDYTQGVKGVGIVNTMEILKVFDEFDKLKQFRKWARRSDLLLEAEEQTQYLLREANEEERYFYELHRKFKNNWYVENDFPNHNVIKAYIHPEVLSPPQLHSLKEEGAFALKPLLKDKVLAVMREIMLLENKEVEHYIRLLELEFRRETQKSIADFMGEGQFAMIRSKRLLKSLED